MPRILDIGVFNAVRESGLAKLMPAIPRIAVGMGTCGQGNGAEEVYHALNEAIHRSGVDVMLTGVGCFGSCFQEPLVSVRLPGYPLVVLSHVDTSDAARILEGVSTGVMPADLVYCKIEEWNHITAHLKYGQGYPDIPSWNTIPFFKGQKKIVLRNCGIINPSDIEEYIAVGGYQALYKVLIDGRPESVIEQIKAARLRGRGGAGFLTGNKWDFLAKAKADTKYIICNADEGDPGAFMNRNEIEGDPHSLLEGMIIGAYGTGATAGIIYVRAEYPLAVTRLNRAIEQAHEYGLLGANILGRGFNFDIQMVQGAGAFVCGEETAMIASLEGHAGWPRPRPPFPAQKGLWGNPTNINNVETWYNIAPIITRGPAWFTETGSAEEPRNQGLFAGGQDSQHRPGGDAAGHSAEELHLRHWRRPYQWTPHQIRADRRTFRRLHPHGDARYSRGLREPGAHRLHHGLRRHGGHGRRQLHGRCGPLLHRVHPLGVLRQVRALPGGPQQGAAHPQRHHQRPGNPRADEPAR